MTMVMTKTDDDDDDVAVSRPVRLWQHGASRDVPGRRGVTAARLRL